MSLETTPIVAVEGLTCRFGKLHALDSVSLAYTAGRVYGLVGANGAGKTTLIKHLMGLQRAQTGTVRVFGLDPVADSVAVLSQTGYLSEDRDLPAWMKVRQLIRFTSAFYPNWDHAHAQELANQFELNLDTRTSAQSRGQLARTGLLLALAHRPRLLVLDEPSSGLDPVVRRDILTAIIRSVADEGRTVIFSSHLMDEVERVADHITMLNHGRVVLNDDLADIKQGHCKLLLRAPTGAQPNWPGILSRQGAQEVAIIAEGIQAQHEDRARAAGFEVLNAAPASMDDIFLARMQGNATKEPAE